MREENSLVRAASFASLALEEKKTSNKPFRKTEQLGATHCVKIAIEWNHASGGGSLACALILACPQRGDAAAVCAQQHVAEASRSSERERERASSCCRSAALSRALSGLRSRECGGLFRGVRIRDPLLGLSSDEALVSRVSRLSLKNLVGARRRTCLCSCRRLDGTQRPRRRRGGSTPRI